MNAWNPEFEEFLVPIVICFDEDRQDAGIRQEESFRRRLYAYYHVPDRGHCGQRLPFEDVECRLMFGRQVLGQKQPKVLGPFEAFVALSHQGIVFLLAYLIHGFIHMFHGMKSVVDDFGSGIRRKRHRRMKYGSHISIAMARMDSSWPSESQRQYSSRLIFFRSSETCSTLLRLRSQMMVM